MKLFKKLTMIAVVVLFVAGMYGCQKEGPAERAGKNIDKALEGAKDAVKDATK